MHLVGVVVVGAGDDVLVFGGNVESKTMLHLLPSPLITILMFFQTLDHQSKALHLHSQLQLRKSIQDRKEMSHTGVPTVYNPVLSKNLCESPLSVQEDAVARASQRADVLLVHAVGNVEQEFDRETQDTLAVRCLTRL